MHRDGGLSYEVMRKEKKHSKTFPMDYYLSTIQKY
jgi:hypothetical protein